MTNTTTNELFGYEETDEGRLKFFSTICHELEDFLTKPLDSYQEVMSESERIDFIKNKLEDAYYAEVEVRQEPDNHEWFWDERFIVRFDIKNTPENLQILEGDEDVYDFSVDEDENIIQIGVLNEWDSFILSEQSYSQKIFGDFCSSYGIDESDVLSDAVRLCDG
ncbi:hypothetical protein N8654_04760 [Synechococcus sp. AH-601-B19]|nr:hypothetical protein [Synechococcus sp. AH-601-B19]